MSLPAVVQLDFDPLLRLGDLSLAWQTVGLAIALIVALAIAAFGRAAHSGAVAARRAGRISLPAVTVQAEPLRLDDLAYIAVAAVPGAVIGGRLFHGLAFWDFYATQPSLLLEPGTGSLSLLGAVVGGTLSGAWMARLLSAPVRRWADALAIPLLVALGLGKLSQLLAGSGQGLPFDGPWAVAFVGPGPWVSALPELPAHPAQAYEGAWLLLAALSLVSLAAPVREFPARHGLLFVLAMVTFLVGRLLIGFSWRDERVLGSFNAEQLLAAVVLGLLLIGLLTAGLARTWRRRDVELGHH